MRATQRALNAASWLLRIGWGSVRQTVRVARRPQFGACGRDVRFDPWGVYAPAERMFLGSDIFIASGARIVATEGFRVSDHVMIGSEFCVLGGVKRPAFPGGSNL